jgi:hypothetical protein
MEMMRNLRKYLTTAVQIICNNEYRLLFRLGLWAACKKYSNKQGAVVANTMWKGSMATL